MSQKETASGARPEALGSISFKKKYFSHLQRHEYSCGVTGEQVKTHLNHHWNQIPNPGTHRDIGISDKMPTF